MHEPRNVPANSATEADGLSQDDYPEPNMEPLGVDVPGVGCVHLNRDIAPPPALHRLIQQSLYDEMLSGAIDLARANIVLRSHFFNRYLKECRECGRIASSSGELNHAAWCKTGRVLALAAEIALDAPAPSKPETKKETTATSGESRAGDGEASRRPMTMDEVLLEQKNACEGQGEAGPEFVGENGEPWHLQGYRDDPRLGARAYIQIEQGNTGQVLEVKGSRVLNAAKRMIACVNSLVGVPDEVLAKAMGGKYFLVRSSDTKEFFGFSAAWIAHSKARQAQEGGAR